MRNAKFFMSINPTTNVVLKEFPFASAQEVDATLARAHAGFKYNRAAPLQSRIQRVLKLADLISTRKMECARAMAQEMGKPVMFGIAELDEVIGLLKHKASVAESVLKPHMLGPTARKAYSLAQPSGIHFCKIDG